MIDFGIEGRRANLIYTCPMSCRSGEMADALDSKSGEGNLMRVQLPPPAFCKSLSLTGFIFN
jgi:hypothetical protein